MDINEYYVSDKHPMYVQHWKPLQPDGGGLPLILVHGGAHSGVCWTSCPDGRPGWALHLVNKGRSVHVVDWPGVGRSPRPDDFLTAGPAPAVNSLIDLIRQIGPVALIGHSIGAAIGVKVADLIPDMICAFIAIAPAAPGIRESGRPRAPITAPVRFDDAAVRQFFTNADRFPKAHVDVYKRSLCDLSPSIYNIVAGQGSNHALSVADLQRLRSIPSAVIAAEQDVLVTEDMSREVAEFLNAELVFVGRDWGLQGFGHMMLIETGSEAIVDRILDWLSAHAK